MPISAMRVASTAGSNLASPSLTTNTPSAPPRLLVTGMNVVPSGVSHGFPYACEVSVATVSSSSDASRRLIPSCLPRGTFGGSMSPSGRRSLHDRSDGGRRAH